MGFGFRWGNKQSVGEPQVHPALGPSVTYSPSLSGWCPSWDPWCRFYGSGLRVLSLSASPAPVLGPVSPHPSDERQQEPDSKSSLSPLLPRCLVRGGQGHVSFGVFAPGSCTQASAVASLHPTAQPL